MKRFIAILLTLAMLPLPAAFAAKSETKPEVIPQSAYTAVENDIWEDIEALEESKIAAVRGRNAAPQDYAKLVDTISEMVEDSATYEEGTLNRNGDFLSWKTTDGIACGYSPRLRAQMNRANVKKTETEEADVQTISSGVKNSPYSDFVSVFQPYYGIDSSFTTQYVEEAQSLVNTLHSSGRAYYREGATIDAIADAMESSAVVLFDSHGDTDYSNGDDYTSQANTSYLCLQTGEGLTDLDYKGVYGDHGYYCHAYYAGYNIYDSSMKYYCVDGTAIANHMDQYAPNNLLWTATCLGMATDGLCTPLRNMGVAVVYGYSQSVTFYGDYLWEELFWDAMEVGYTVHDAIDYMKTNGGSWDNSTQKYDHYNWYYDDDVCYSVYDARASRAAFPIVVSQEDYYPGQGYVDNTQSVYSTWTLWDQGIQSCGHYNTWHDYLAPTCTENGHDCYWCSNCGAQVSYVALPALGHSFQSAVTPPTCTVGGHTDYWCTRCGYSYQDNWTGTTSHYFRSVVLTAPTATSEGLVKYICKNCDYSYVESVPAGTQVHICPSDAFHDLDNRAWYHEGVDYVLSNGLFNGTGSTTFEPETAMTRAMMVTVLWRQAGKPAPHGENPFSDVAGSYWYTDAITWAVENGIVNGIGGGRFDPDGNITREQMAAILFRYAGHIGMDTSAGADLSVFPDANRVSNWARDAISWANAEGLVTGSKEGATVYLLPEGNATRAQVATILMRFNKL